MRFWTVAVVRRRSDIAHYRWSRCPAHYKSRVAVCYGTDAGFASVPSSERLESDRCRGSGAAVSLPYVSGSLRQQLRSQGSPQALQSIQLLIEHLGSAAHAGVRDLVPTFLPTTRSIHLVA